MKKIIINDNAGRGYCKKNLPLLLEYFENKFDNFDIAYTKGPEDATIIADEAINKGVKEIISVGGDGTALEVLKGVKNRDVTLSFFPAGTGNDLVKSLGFTTDIEEYLLEYSKQVDNNCEKLVDVGYSKEYGPFFSICGLGFVTDTLIYVNQTRNSLIKGPFAFANGVFQSLKNLKATALEIEVDNVTYRRKAVLVAVINSLYSGGGMKFVPDSRIDDGFLHVFLVSEIGSLELLRVFPKVYKGEHLSHKAVEVMKGKKVLIKSKDTLSSSFDGDVYGFTPLNLYIKEKSQKVIIGPKFMEGE